MSGRRDYSAEYARRQRLARARGFTGYAQQRRLGRTVRGARGLGRLPDAAREARSDALHVLRIARERGVSIEQAASRERVPVQLVRWWAGDALQPTRGGRTLPRKGDRLLRLYPIVLDGGDGVEFVEIRGSNAARGAQQIFDVQYGFIQGAATEGELRAIAGRKVSGRLVESDPARLMRIGDAGGFDIPEAYRGALG